MKKALVLALCFLLLSSTVTASVSCDGFTRGESTETKTEEATEPAKPTESDAQTDSPDASEAPTSTDIPMESEKVTESETSVDTVAPTESEKVTESETFAVTDTPTESETVTEALAETETETHEHNFDIKDTSEKYLKSEATCTKPAYYYYSCLCGEKGSNYYKSGKANGHVYDQKDTSDKYVKIAESCTKRGLYYYSCKCGAKGEDTFNGDAPKGHVFDQKNTSAKYVKYAPTCTKYGLYYYSCVCGEKGEKTFNGTELGHVFDIMNTDEKYLKTPQTSSSPAVYYYSCLCGAKGEETFKREVYTSSYTVYAMTGLAYIHYTKDDDRNFCDNLWIGRALEVVESDGTWYKIKAETRPEGYAYVMCKYTTMDINLVTFVECEEQPVAYLASAYQPAPLGKDLLSPTIYAADGYFVICSINKTGDWALVRFYGTDTNGGTYDGNKITFYCKLSYLDVHW